MRKIKDIVKGFAVVSLVGVGYLSSCLSVFVNDITSDPSLDQGIREIRHVNVEDNFVYCNRNSKRSKISLNSIQDFVDSLFVCKISNADSLKEVKMYDIENENDFSIYESKDGRIEATVLNTGEVLCCKMRFMREHEISALKSMMYGTNYSIKDISNGVMLERNDDLCL